MRYKNLFRKSIHWFLVYNHHAKYEPATKYFVLIDERLHQFCPDRVCLSGLALPMFHAPRCMLGGHVTCLAPLSQSLPAGRNRVSAPR